MQRLSRHELWAPVASDASLQARLLLLRCCEFVIRRVELRTCKSQSLNFERSILAFACHALRHARFKESPVPRMRSTGMSRVKLHVCVALDRHDLLRRARASACCSTGVTCSCVFARSVLSGSVACLRSHGRSFHSGQEVGNSQL